MEKYLKNLPNTVEKIKALNDIIITNIVLIGQVPAPTFKENRRTNFFLDRLSEAGADECTTDGYRNPISIIRGTDPTKPPIFVAAHMDTPFDADVDHNYTVQKGEIKGAGVLDNSVGLGVLLSMPDILRALELKFESDIVLVGSIQSIGKGNLRGIRHLLKTWKTPIRGAVVVEGGELGRLNCTTDGMIRCEITCHISRTNAFEHTFKPNAILILHEVINQILEIRLPQRPRSRVIIGKISGGFKYGTIAYQSSLGLEIQSDSDKMVKSIYNNIKDIVEGIHHEHHVEMEFKTISNVNASKLPYNHPLVKSSVKVMKALDLTPVSEPSESELSIFLSRKIPAVTLGVTKGNDYHLESSAMEIEPMYKGIAQIIGVMMAIDSGICDE